MQSIFLIISGLLIFGSGSFLKAEEVFVDDSQSVQSTRQKITDKLDTYAGKVFNSLSQKSAPQVSSLVRGSQVQGSQSTRQVMTEDLDAYARKVFNFFWDKGTSTNEYRVPQFTNFKIDANGVNNLWTSSSGAGFALAVYAIAVEREWKTWAEVLPRIKATLNFYNKNKDSANNDFHTHGFLSHFYEVATGNYPVQDNPVEYSVLDTAWFLMGALFVKEYLLLHENTIKADTSVTDNDTIVQTLVAVINALYARVDWTKAVRIDSQTQKKYLSHGWKNGVDIPFLYDTYDESLGLYLLAIGAPNPSKRISASLWDNIIRNKVSVLIDESRKAEVIGHNLGLFVHTYSLAWLDFRGFSVSSTQKPTLPKTLQTEVLVAQNVLPAQDQLDIDYFLNSKNATLSNRIYTDSIMENEKDQSFDTYPEYWGLSAAWSGDNSYSLLEPYSSLENSTQNGRVAPGAVMATLVFQPTIVKEFFDNVQNDTELEGLRTKYGFSSSFTLDTPVEGDDVITKIVLDIDKGAELLMLENNKTGLVWSTMGHNQNLRDAMQLVGFPVILGETSPAMNIEPLRSWLAPSFSFGNSIENEDTVNDLAIVPLTIVAVVGAQQYQIQVALDADFDGEDVVLLTSNVPTMTDVSPLEGLPILQKEVAQGNYSFRIRALRRNAINTELRQYTVWSVTQTLKFNLSSTTQEAIDALKEDKDKDEDKDEDEDLLESLIDWMNNFFIHFLKEIQFPSSNPPKKPLDKSNPPEEAKDTDRPSSFWVAIKGFCYDVYDFFGF